MITLEIKTKASVPIAVLIKSPGINKLTTSINDIVFKLNANCQTTPNTNISS